ncbi:hypothetical protein LFYK43_08300 [Ligilactobacillus salitolerans]|uniref:Uncharacterized protein n=1 Tax=Ligilactobacillus salitolerans TaxID=1808352 RepID=A0A401IS63_9LACO|nr:hypothetical protein [Ligilactobacillus salitolerans]GBG94371.1 hypothetical protein LFYK43_08300 [Ligilactobacillus salitolerans]
MKLSITKKIAAFLILACATFAVLGYILYVCTYLVLNFNVETVLLAVITLPLFLFFFRFLWFEV